MEHRSVLRHRRNRVPKRRLRNLVDTLSPHENPTAFDVDETQQQPGDGRFASARKADQAYFRAMRNLQRELFEQQRLRRLVSKTNVPHLDSVMCRSEWLRFSRVDHRGRIEQ